MPLRLLPPLAFVLLLAAGCRTAAPTTSSAAPAAVSVRAKRYYLLKGPATVGWVSDRPFRYVSYDPKAQGELADASGAASFKDFSRLAKKKGYRLVRTKQGP